MTERHDRQDQTWMQLMELGARTGCHQMPERSFFWKDYQFPICARCTGVWIGQLTAGVLLAFQKWLSPFASVCLLGVLGIDWLMQRIGLRTSTNTRRLLTGISGGIGIIMLYAQLLRTGIRGLLRLYRMLRK